MELAVEIKNRRETLGLSIKEMSDAIGLGRDGDKLFRAWEKGSMKPTQEQVGKIISFMKKRTKNKHAKIFNESK